ncbi:hypothetical protein HaLaN_27361, partial [Haematococcus lacustris]
SSAIHGKGVPWPGLQAAARQATQTQPAGCRHISASSSEHSNLCALAVTHAAALAKAKTPAADSVRPATPAAHLTTAELPPSA